MRTSGVLLALLLACGCGPGTTTRAVAPAGTPPSPSRTGHPALPVPTLLAATPPSSVPYDKFSDEHGELTDAHQAFSLFKRPGEIDALYRDAFSGNLRALRFLQTLEEVSADAARAQAENVSSPACALLAVLPRCHTTWALFQPLHLQGPGAQRLLQVTQDAYEARLRQLAPQRRLNQAALDMWLAQGVLRRVNPLKDSPPRSPPKPPAPRLPAGRDPRFNLPTTLAELEALYKASRLPPEVLQAKLLEAEASSLGPRLSADLAVLERMRPGLAHPPPDLPHGYPLWTEYRLYWDKRVTQMTHEQRGGLPAEQRAPPPLTWEAYELLRGDFARGLAYEAVAMDWLLAQAKLPPAQRAVLKDFTAPALHPHVGVFKPQTGLRFADILVIERAPTPGRPPRIETFSLKSRNLVALPKNELVLQVEADARASVRFYGETVDVRRFELDLRGRQVRVDKVHLFYDARFKPTHVETLKDAVDTADKLGVTLRFQ